MNFPNYKLPTTLPAGQAGNYQRGFMLIEGLVLLFIFVVAVLTFYQVYVLGVQHIIESKKRLAAVSLANERMEILRNTPYKDILLDRAGLPSLPGGSALTDLAGEGITYDVTDNDNASGITFRVLTEVYYKDDPQDGLAPPSGTDAVSNDYKRVIVTVLWGKGLTDMGVQSQQIYLTSFFIPPTGLETVLSGGVLAVNVVDDDGVAISGALVSVGDVNGATAPDYTSSGTTGAEGHVIFENVPAANEMYEITVTKTDYETITTLPAYPATTFYPRYVHASILNGTFTTVTVVTDENPDFNIETTDPFCGAFEYINFTIFGGRKIGTDTNGDPVYVNASSIAPLAVSSNGSGIVDMDSVAGYTPSSGLYTVTLTETGYTFWKLKALDESSRTNDPSEVVVSSGITFDCGLIIIKESDSGVFVEVSDSATAGPLAYENVRMSGGVDGYNVPNETDEYGYAYFPKQKGETPKIVSGDTYDVTASATGYQNEVASVTVSGLETITLTLDPI